MEDILPTPPPDRVFTEEQLPPEVNDECKCLPMVWWIFGFLSAWAIQIVLYFIWLSTLPVS